ncbi:hypothetical protein BON22_1120 [Cyberlindnera fabianii]|uniref:Uncharacterized protein n=1 Tax=Cyberlindnera fabianii TaxID=36022 RepID=A0A1V2LAH0_CYBFA|nr:hypothetical protein BON22_1120 [Cyberlindnera fabianii]
MEHNESTPSLVGANVRNVTDHDEYDKTTSPPQTNQRVPLGHHEDEHVKDYTTVNELANEGALISDEQGYDELLDATGNVKPNVTKTTAVLTGVQDKDLSKDTKTKIIESTLPQPVEIDDSHKEFVVVDIPHHPSVDVEDAGTPADDASTATGTPSIYELKNDESSMSLEELIDSQMASMSSLTTDLQKKISDKKKTRAPSRSRSRLRNVVETAVPDSVIENDSLQQVPAGAREGMASPLIQSRSQSAARSTTSGTSNSHSEKPHLARGDSYSGIQTYEQRPGRRPERHGDALLSNLSSREYLRSVSRSRSRVSKEAPISNMELVDEGALVTDDLGHDPQMMDRIDFTSETLQEEDEDPAEVKHTSKESPKSTDVKSTDSKSDKVDSDNDLDALTKKLESELKDLSLNKSNDDKSVDVAADKTDKTAEVPVETKSKPDKSTSTDDSDPVVTKDVLESSNTETEEAEPEKVTSDKELSSKEGENPTDDTSKASIKTALDTAAASAATGSTLLADDEIDIADAEEKDDDSKVDTETVTDLEGETKKEQTESTTTEKDTEPDITQANDDDVETKEDDEEDEEIPADDDDETTEGVIEPTPTTSESTTSAPKEVNDADGGTDVLSNVDEKLKSEVDATQDDEPIEDDTKETSSEVSKIEKELDTDPTVEAKKDDVTDSKATSTEISDVEKKDDVPALDTEDSTTVKATSEDESVDVPVEVDNDVEPKAVTESELPVTDEEQGKTTDKSIKQSDDAVNELIKATGKVSIGSTADETERLINQLESEIGDLSESTKDADITVDETEVSEPTNTEKADITVDETENDVTDKELAPEAKSEEESKSKSIPIDTTETVSKDVKVDVDTKDDTSSSAPVNQESDDDMHEPTKEEIIEMLKDEPVYLYTSLAGGGFFMPQRTNKLATILTANRIPFTYRDLGTDEEARNVWRRYGKGRSPPGIVRGKDDIIGNWEEIEEVNEDYRVRELIYETL